MNKKLLIGILVLLPLVILGGYYLYQHKGTFKIQTSESPQEVVAKFYGYINDGGPTSLGEAYKLVSKKHHNISEDNFNSIVLNYPEDLKMKTINGKMLEDKAIVTIEYSVPSSFGGDYVVETDINLIVDEKTKSWKIDFAGDTYDSQDSE